MSSLAPDAPGLRCAEDRRPRPRRRSAAPALVLAGALAVVAAGVHMLVTPEHLAAWWGYGAFFIVITNVEIAIVGLLVIKPSTWAVQVAIWTTLATLLMYLVSRTAGIPLGPDARHGRRGRRPGRRRHGRGGRAARPAVRDARRPRPLPARSPCWR